MTKQVVVWGTGNVGQPAIRTVLAVEGLELSGAIVSNPKKVGRDIGELADVASVGITATDGANIAAVDALLGRTAAVVYTASLSEALDGLSEPREIAAAFSGWEARMLERWMLISEFEKAFTRVHSLYFIDVPAVLLDYYAVWLGIKQHLSKQFSALAVRLAGGAARGL